MSGPDIPRVADLIWGIGAVFMLVIVFFCYILAPWMTLGAGFALTILLLYLGGQDA